MNTNDENVNQPITPNNDDFSTPIMPDPSMNPTGAGDNMFQSPLENNMNGNQQMSDQNMNYGQAPMPDPNMNMGYDPNTGMGMPNQFNNIPQAMNNMGEIPTENNGMDMFYKSSRS